MASHDRHPGYTLDSISFSARETEMVCTIAAPRNEVLLAIYNALQQLGHTSALVNRAFGLLIARPPFSFLNVGRRFTFSLTSVSGGTQVTATYTHGLVSFQSRARRQQLLESLLRATRLNLPPRPAEHSETAQDHSDAPASPQGTSQHTHQPPKHGETPEHAAPQAPSAAAKAAAPAPSSPASSAPASAPAPDTQQRPAPPQASGADAPSADTPAASNAPVSPPSPSSPPTPASPPESPVDDEAHAFVAPPRHGRVSAAAWRLFWFVIGVGLMALILMLIDAAQ